MQKNCSTELQKYNGFITGLIRFCYNSVIFKSSRTSFVFILLNIFGFINNILNVSDFIQ